MGRRSHLQLGPTGVPCPWLPGTGLLSFPGSIFCLPPGLRPVVCTHFYHIGELIIFSQVCAKSPVYWVFVMNRRLPQGCACAKCSGPPWFGSPGLGTPTGDKRHVVNVTSCSSHHYRHSSDLPQSTEKRTDVRTEQSMSKNPDSSNCPNSPSLSKFCTIWGCRVLKLKQKHLWMCH